MNQEKSIETPHLLIKGNLIIWDKMLIQISSISYLSEAPLDKKPFPLWSLLPIGAALFVFKINAMMSFGVMSIGLGWILIWFLINKMRQEKRILTVAMNSNQLLYFRFNDKAFLHKAMMVLQAILINGGVGSKNIVINIRDNKIGGDARIFNNMTL